MTCHDSRLCHLKWVDKIDNTEQVVIYSLIFVIMCASDFYCAHIPGCWVLTFFTVCWVCQIQSCMVLFYLCFTYSHAPPVTTYSPWCMHRKLSPYSSLSVRFINIRKCLDATLRPWLEITLCFSAASFSVIPCWSCWCNKTSNCKCN